jgi:SNF2 family DNA or RNA helicase
MRVILPFTGINLTAADTVIIYDSDFNPQNDLQAQARCHRIGQTKSVKVYRLLTRKSYEMQMFHMSSLKMGLDQAVLQGLESGNGLVCQYFTVVFNCCRVQPDKLVSVFREYFPRMR